MTRRIGRSRRLVLGASLLISGLLTVIVAPGGAHAQWAVCYNDPIVYMDNGTTMLLGTSVQTDASNISAINYTVHIPVGVSVTKIVYFGPDKSLEHLTWTADNTANTYDSDTQVVATGGAYSATSGMVVIDQGMTSNLANGLTGQDLLNHILDA